MIKHKSIKRTEFLRKLLEKLGLTWELVKSAELKSRNKYKLILRFYDKILKTRYVSISHKELMIYSSIELDMTYNFTTSLMATCYYDVVNEELINCIRKKLRQYIKFNILPYSINYIDSIDFDYILENLILDGIDLSEFPDIKEVL